MIAAGWRTVLAFAFVGLVSCGGDDDGPPSPPPPPPHPGEPGPTWLAITITDGPGGPAMPGRVILYDEGGEQLRIGRLDYIDRMQSASSCPLVDGAVGTWEGIILGHGVAEIPIGVSACDGVTAIPYGRYHARVYRGIQFEVYEADLDLRKDVGLVRLDAPLARAFDPEGTLAADLHVHAIRSPDSFVPTHLRVMSEMAAGIQVIGNSDHNSNGDFEDDIEALAARPWVASMPGNEISYDLGHFNVFPVEIDASKPRGGAFDPTGFSARKLFDTVRAMPRRPLIQINHPRYRWAAYFDSYGWRDTWPPPMPVDFDSIEILPGVNAYNVAGDERQEEMMRDFYTLAKNGVFVTAVGASDTHHLSGVLAGVPRTYVYVDDTRTDPFDMDGFLDGIRRRRVVATSGPWLDVKVSGAGPGETARAEGGQVTISIGLRQASFVHANRIRVWVRGELRYTLPVPEGARSFDWTSTETLGPGDTWIGVDATGDVSLPIEVSGDDLWQINRGGMDPTALINPILVDVDGDGRFALPGAKPMAPIIDVPPPPRPGADQHCGCSNYEP